MLIYREGELEQVEVDAMAAHAFIEDLPKHPENNAIGLNEYLLVQAYATAADRQVLDDWLIERLRQVVKGYQKPASTIYGRHAKQIERNWLATFSESEEVSDAVRQAASLN